MPSGKERETLKNITLVLYFCYQELDHHIDEFVDWEKTSLKPYVDMLDKHALRSDTFSDNGHDPYSRVSSRLSGSSVDPLSRTVTAGELALAAGGRELELIARVGLSPYY